MAERKQILLTNDDGIRSPGLWAAAEALSSLGFVQVVAPRQQYSGAGRSLPSNSDGIIQIEDVEVNGQTWQVYSVGGSPAQAVLHAVVEILPEMPDLIVSGINFGENIGSGITISGTVGAAMEGASFGIPALAVSLETDIQHHYHHSQEVDFSAAAYFTAQFAGWALTRQMPADVDVLKVDVPSDATPQTPWAVTRVSRRRYFEPLKPERPAWSVPAKVGYRVATGQEQDAPGTDVYAISVQRVVSVTPLSLDLTARVELLGFERSLRE
jgi:5'-nucleotidase